MRRSKTELKGISFLVATGGLAVTWLAYAFPILGFVLIGLTLLLVARRVQGRVKGEVDGGLWGPLAVAGIVIAFASCGIKAKRIGIKHEKTEIQEAAVKTRKAQDVREAQHREAQVQAKAKADRHSERERLLSAERQKPLAERALEADKSIETVTGRDAIASAICYADTLLDEPTTPELSNLRKTRNRAAKEIVREYQAELAKESRGLLCSDGTVSPSCSCGGSRRGCCSHHGGVAGCEPVPKAGLVCEGSDDYWMERHLTLVGRPLSSEVGNPDTWFSPLRVVNRQ